MAATSCNACFDPDAAGQGGPFTTTTAGGGGLPSPDQASGGQASETAGLSTSATTSDVGPIVGWLRTSPYSEEELRLMVDLAGFAVILLLALYEFGSN